MFSQRLFQAKKMPVEVKPFRNRPRAALLTLPLLIAGCSALGLDESLWHNEDDVFYLDAQSCRTSAAFKPKVRVTTSGLGDQEIGAGYDEKLYRNCMTARNWAPKTVDETKQAIEDCRNHALRLGVATPGEPEPHLVRYLDSEAFDECLLEHGVEGIVRVQPLQPAQPPAKP